MTKSTSNLLRELKRFSDFKEFYNKNKEDISTYPLHLYIESLIEAKQLTKSSVIEKAEMSEVYAYQIMSGIKKNPDREKVLCLAFGMGLTLDETQDMLKKTGYATLYAKNEFDVIIMYGLYKKMSIIDVNNLLYEYGRNTLG